MGVTGYCMGGSIAMRLAAACPQQVAAAASYHGGRLATDAPDSPHRLLATASAELYFGHADQDESMDAAAIADLEAALDAAGATYTSEVYEGAPHGFAVPGSSRYREDAAERHWRTMLALFARALQ